MAAVLKYTTAKSYTHVQSTSAATWVVDYVYPFIPIVDVFIYNGAGELEKIIPQSIVRTTPHSVTITFSSPHTGKAHIAG